MLKSELPYHQKAGDGSMNTNRTRNTRKVPSVATGGAETGFIQLDIYTYRIFLRFPGFPFHLRNRTGPGDSVATLRQGPF